MQAKIRGRSVTFIRSIYDAAARRSRQRSLATVDLKSCSIPPEKRHHFTSAELDEADAYLKSDVAQTALRRYRTAQAEKPRVGPKISATPHGPGSESADAHWKIIWGSLRRLESISESGHDIGHQVYGTGIRSLLADLLKRVSIEEAKAGLRKAVAAKGQAMMDSMNLSTVRHKLPMSAVKCAATSSDFGMLFNRALDLYERWTKAIADMSIPFPRTSGEAVASFRDYLVDTIGMREVVAKVDLHDHGTWCKGGGAELLKKTKAIEIEVFSEILETEEGFVAGAQCAGYDPFGMGEMPGDVTAREAAYSLMISILDQRAEYQRCVAAGEWRMARGDVGHDYAAWCKSAGREVL